MKNGQARLWPDGRDDAALRQQTGEAHRLDEHGLAARVGTGDEDGPFVGSELQIERHHDHLAAFQQRVTAGADVERPRVDRGGETVHLHGVAGAGTEVVEGDAHLPRGAEALAMRP